MIKLYDPSGRVIRASSSGFSALPRGRRAYGWDTGTTSASLNSLIQSGGDELRRKAREMIRNNGWAASALASYVANSIGTGIKPKPRHPSKEVRRLLQDEWRWFTDQSDADSSTDFYGQQALAVRSMREAGEVFVRLRPRRKSDGLRIPFQLQLLESEHVPFEKNEPQNQHGGVTMCGIAFDGIGRRAAYHMYPVHPGEWLSVAGSNISELKEIKSSEILHLYEPLRPGQVRGQPWLTPVMLKLHELIKYDDAELVRKGLTTMLVGWTRSNDQYNPTIPTVTENEMPPGEEPPTTGVEYGILQSGAVIDLDEGRDMGWFTPPSVDTSYESFMKVQLRCIASALGLTYEMMTNDLSGVNYSSIRQGVLEFRRRCEQFQHMIVVYQLCRPVWYQFIKWLAITGRIDTDELAAYPMRYLDVKWMPPRWDWVDPLKDVQAEIIEINGGLNSRSAAVESRGETSEELDEQIAEDNERADKLGIKYTSDGRFAVKTPPSGEKEEKE